jgi:hypothetical protein
MARIHVMGTGMGKGMEMETRMKGPMVLGRRGMETAGRLPLGVL